MEYRGCFLIHGLDDTIIAPANSRRDYAAAREPKSLWLVPGAGHAASRAVAGAEYDRRVVTFFRRYLGAS